MQACKPGSVSRRNRPDPYHLSRPHFAVWLKQPTRNAPTEVGIESANLLRGVTYLAFQLVRFAVPPSLPLGRWALTPPFHYDPDGTRPSRLLVFCGTVCLQHCCQILPVRKYDALMLPGLSLLTLNVSTIKRLAFGCKGRKDFLDDDFSAHQHPSASFHIGRPGWPLPEEFPSWFLHLYYRRRPPPLLAGSFLE
jgi:hypothetical protein